MTFDPSPQRNPSFSGAPRFSESEIDESTRLLEILRARGLDHTYVRYFELFHQRGQVDKLRCYANLFHEPGNKTYIAIDYLQDAILEHTERKIASDFLTMEMVNLHMRVEEAFTTHGILDYRDASYRFSVYVFEHMVQKEAIMFLLEERGMSDTGKIAALLKDVDIESVSQPLREGIL